MSGVVGWIDFRRDLGEQGRILHSMTEAMRFRGPDTEDVWLSTRAGIGHRGLAASGSAEDVRPARAETGRGTVYVAHAGEVYNRDELRRDIEAAGGELRNGSTAEALLQAFLLWGAEFADRLNGALAFAIWDGRNHRLHLGRDRMGVKPLYYYEYPGGILFASEPKGIIANPRFEARLDVSKLPIVLQPRLSLPGETPLKGLNEVPPAHVLTYTQTGLARRRYWELVSEPHHDSFERTAYRVRELLDDTVSRQLVTGVPLGAMLSGGIDSTSVAALAMRALRKDDPSSELETFCVQFESDPAHFVSTELRPDIDAPYAAAAAEFIGTRHTTLTAAVQDLLDVIPATRRARDLPGWGQFDASMYLIFDQIRRNCSVALTGEAADEVFGGYPYFFKQDVVGRDTFPWLGDGPRLSRFLSPGLMAEIDPEEDERARYSELLGNVPRLAGESPEDARLREVFYLGLSGPLAVILDRKERMSMAHGLDVRVPFCDHRLIEYVWNVPWELKSRGGVKGLLKAAMADVLPASTVNRKKSAYPHVQNPVYDQELIREASWIVNDKASPLSWMFDGEGLGGLIQQISANAVRGELPGGSNQAALLIQLVEMRNWMDEYQVALP
ncbi:asparagine synthase (glutamine-hydrolyzing) [Streptomyces sp. NPDC054766]|uniref:asparagine synthase (glutamine-hydrolyzing) n=1 Tax=Streptomyces rhizosphaerihabitans TaxID=1266770 RepID=UPI0021BE6EFA|nr:asparagine synthase (glutamine-hydrolyzing) [Streptomyces rhizosphaerihabitans]MCT9008482.1 asparagine synthase (glutamine-hydrolyzing) [Streptomyces rhizosphaerihabitans]